jgi:hypothetical protein
MKTRSIQVPCSRRDAGSALAAGSILAAGMISLAMAAALATAKLGTAGAERAGVFREGDRVEALKLAKGGLEVAQAAFLDHRALEHPVPARSCADPFEILAGCCRAPDGTDVSWKVRKATTFDAAGVERAAPVESWVAEASVDVGAASIRMRRPIDVRKTLVR